MEQGGERAVLKTVEDEKTGPLDYLTAILPQYHPVELTTSAVYVPADMFHEEGITTGLVSNPWILPSTLPRMS